MNSPGARIAGAEWVIVGAATDDGRVLVVASKTLSGVDLEAKVAEPEPWGRPFSFEPPHIRSYTMSGEMQDFVLVVADDYPDALRKLFDFWNPQPDRPGLPSPQLALPSERLTP